MGEEAEERRAVIGRRPERWAESGNGSDQLSADMAAPPTVAAASRLLASRRPPRALDPHPLPSAASAASAQHRTAPLPHSTASAQHRTAPQPRVCWHTPILPAWLASARPCDVSADASAFRIGLRRRIGPGRRRRRRRRRRLFLQRADSAASIASAASATASAASSAASALASASSGPIRAHGLAPTSGISFLCAQVSHITEFYRVFFFCNSSFFHRFLPSITLFFIGSHRILPSGSKRKGVRPDRNAIRWVLLDFTGFYWVFFTGFYRTCVVT